MTNVEGIIGTLVSFIVNKSIGKIDPLPTDKRKKVCRSLTKLYYFIQALDEVTTYFEKSLNDFSVSQEPESVIYAINNNSYHAELVTNMFVDLSYELEDGLETVDPTLSKCCQLLYASTNDKFLGYLSDYVQLGENDDGVFMLVKQPKALVNATDLESLYNEIKRAITEQRDINSLTLLLNSFIEDVQYTQINFDNEQAMTQLRQTVSHYNDTLKEAKEHLRMLLRGSFSIEEILFP